MRLKFLIDTNILIGLEDSKPIEPIFTRFSRLVSRHGIKLFVHEKALEDITRDKNKSRMEITKSKLNKYELLKGRINISYSDLTYVFGDINSNNDKIDAHHLFELNAGSVDFLVTQDKKIRSRALNNLGSISDRVFSIEDAVDQIEQLFEPNSDPIRVSEVSAGEIDPNDSLFNSLKQTYSEFEKWWRKCVNEHRKCWVIYDKAKLVGLVVRKNEGKNVLKICTFKVDSNYTGKKFGELLLKKVIWYVQYNSNYTSTYLTLFESQTQLIDLLEYYGFKNNQTNENGELIYSKKFLRKSPQNTHDKSPYQIAREYYPLFVFDKNIKGYIVPIQENYHDKLFPDLSAEIKSSVENTTLTIDSYSRSGNAIRKVYISRAPLREIEAGSILFFYKGKSNLMPSKALTAIGILENSKHVVTRNELVRETAGRSVYTAKELGNDWNPSRERPVKIYNFILVSYIFPPIELKRLNQLRGIKSDAAPQSTFEIKDFSVLEKLLRIANLKFKL